MRSLDALQLQALALPKNDSGQVISPRYLPAASPYGRAWVEYCERVPAAAWPVWLAQDLAIMQSERR